MNLVHAVFFTLKDGSESARSALLTACQTHLTGHPGTTFFSCGTRTPDLTRPVNDQDYDVALVVVFDSRASHDAYQVAPRHLRFIEENKESWAKVQVFDADVAG